MPLECTCKRIQRMIVVQDAIPEGRLAACLGLASVISGVRLRRPLDVVNPMTSRRRKTSSALRRRSWSVRRWWCVRRRTWRWNELTMTRDCRRRPTFSAYSTTCRLQWATCPPCSCAASTIYRHQSNRLRRRRRLRTTIWPLAPPRLMYTLRRLS